MKTVLVNAEALWQLLVAVTGPDYFIRELQATIKLPDNPISILLDDYHRAREEFNKKEKEQIDGNY